MAVLSITGQSTTIAPVEGVMVGSSSCCMQARLYERDDWRRLHLIWRGWPEHIPGQVTRLARKIAANYGAALPSLELSWRAIGFFLWMLAGRHCSKTLAYGQSMCCVAPNCLKTCFRAGRRRFPAKTTSGSGKAWRRKPATQCFHYGLSISFPQIPSVPRCLLRFGDHNDLAMLGSVRS